ncbi:uncharacterized protein LOC118734189 [Rhagoletis pomonella]|uniref:uncharacterized protein LOC118734189 n=1 Tax=Rhagoletis pomonella TaxID=28610 RepID=UPI0017835BDD|nr:uncharacterized protein LOC118734189 [Rhagoletis pomonella]
MQGGYTKHPCYFCEWDSRAKDPYKCSVWPPRKGFQIGIKNVLNIPLVKPDNIILPPLHLKLGYMKQFVKRLDKNSESFLHLETVFPKLSDAKIKEGIFIGPQIRKLMIDENFVEKLNEVEKRAWLSFILEMKEVLIIRKWFKSFWKLMEKWDAKCQSRYIFCTLTWISSRIIWVSLATSKVNDFTRKSRQ